MHKNLRRSFDLILIIAVLVTSLGGIYTEAKAASPYLMNEFQPNPDGTDPNPMSFELSGPASTAFDLWILGIENDGYNGTVDSADHVTGSFDANGLAVVSIPDLENPSFTLILTDTFTGAAGSTDIDPANDGTLDLSTLGTIFDAVGVSDAVADDAVMYGASLGGVDILYNGQFEPLLAFRDGTTGDWYNTVTVDFGLPTQHVGVFDASGSGTELNGSDFDNDPTTSVSFNTFGSVNPSYTAPSGDTTPPTMQTLSPADDSTGVAVSTNLVISFDENVQKGTGNITIHLASDDSVVQTIDVTDAAVTVSGADVTIDPPSDLTVSTAYYVNIPSGAIEDTSANDYAGITDATTWSFTTVAASLPTVIINEVDSDTPGTDAAEFVELYDGGTGNTALDGLVVVFFNGSVDTSYAAYDLDGYSTDANGYFVLGNAGVSGVDFVFTNNFLQNGADAVALFVGDATDFPNGTAVTTTNLLDAIVYDTNDADDAGLLALLNASEPQVNEGTNNSADESNQRCPNGTGGERNTSSYAQFNPTPGAENICMNVATNMIINEVDADTPGTDTAEFLELYDGGAGNTALDGLVVVFYNGSDDLSYTPAIDLDGQTTGADGYFVICGNAANVANCDLDVSPDSDLIQNGADAVALFIGDDTDFPNDTPITTANLLDAIVYDTNDGDDAALLALLNASEPQVNEGTNNSADESNQRCPDGTGGQRNTSSYAQYLPTAGTANVCNNNAIDLELTKTVDDNNPNEGDTIIYTLTVSNVSTTQAATNIVVRDYLPDMLTQIDNTHILCAQGTVSLPGINSFEWAVGDLATGSSTACTITVDVRTGTDGTSFDNSAEVWSVTETNDPDSTPGNMGASPAEDDEALVTVNVGVPAACGMPATLISTIQGSGALSPEDGNIHTIEGVVVGDFQTSAGLSGFFLQEEPTDEDGNPATSEGIFVFDGAVPALDVNVGEVVRVTGTVDEYYDLTELTAVSSVLLCSAGAYTPTTITLPVASMDVWEQHEGMLVTIPQTLVASGNYTWGRYGEVELSVGTRLSIPTNVVAPGTAAIAMLDLNNRSRIQLDDGRTAQNPVPVAYLGAGNTLREGDTIPSLTGVVNYGYGVYEIQPVDTVDFTRVNTRPATPPAVGGTVKVVGTNVLNYFVTLDTGSPVCGPAGGMDCRGANTASEFTRQRDKIISAITAMDADVIGVMEMENHPTDAALTDLVNGLNAAAGAGTYAAISTGTIGTDAIKVALIYKPAVVTPLGGFAILDSSVDPSFIDTKNRPTLAQTFVEIASSERFTVAVNHLKSKGSDCNSLGDPDTGDGQGNCNITRTNAATALVNWLATGPTGSGDPDFLIIGDLNSYAMEDPIAAITSSGYTNLISSFVGAGAYSYEFNGESGYLDHALATNSLAGQVTGVAEWHINADEPAALDYNDFNQTGLYVADMYRAADHDPVIIGLALGAPPVVLFGANTVPADGSSLTTGPTQILVEFSKDVLNDGSAGAANNTDNYMLLEAMGDGFQTTSCAAGASSSDFSVPINSAVYSNVGGFIATLNINNGVPLPAGTYRLFVCGTTSITDLTGLELNGGLSDTVVNFTVGAVSELPSTGFPQGMVTPLAEQPQDMQYIETVMMLEIPSLGVSTPIVGVPISDSGWDITWLGRNAGYLAGTAFPTWNGNTVITGHVWDANNLPGPFANVKNLAYGDMIQIQAWGLTYTYQVRETKLVRPWQVNSVLKEEAYDWVTLVTCEDYEDSSQKYASRRVIRAVLVDVQ